MSIHIGSLALPQAAAPALAPASPPLFELDHLLQLLYSHLQLLAEAVAATYIRQGLRQSSSKAQQGSTTEVTLAYGTVALENRSTTPSP